MPGPPAPLVDALRARYTFHRELGRGGMATVYLARDLRHDRFVAFKLLRPDLAAVLGHDRFLREIRLTAGLQHPHILPLLDSDSAAGFLYYVMPYVEGESLRQRLEPAGQLPLDEALSIARVVASALDYAHGQGVIHRDIKPENILLYRNEPMVADFGIALAASSAGQERLTETGLSLGTPAYMSPEQASADPRLDGRSDQYSLACVVYEMLAGEPPYTGPTAQAIIAKRLSEPIPHIGTLRSVPRSVETALTRALAKAPADRFPSVASFAAALERAEPQRLSGKRMAVVAGVLAGLTGITLLAFWLKPNSQPIPFVSRQLTFTGKATEPVLSPDGRFVVYVSGNRSLVRQQADGTEPVVLVPPARYAGNPRWTADGRFILAILMRDSSELAATWAVPSSGGPPRKVLEDAVPYDTGPDSATIARIPHGQHRIDVVNWRTGKLVRSIPLPDSLGGTGHDGIAWSPRGGWFAFEGLGALWAIPVAGGHPNRVGPGWAPHWVRSFDVLYFLKGQPGGEALFRATIDSRSGQVRDGPVRIASLPGASWFPGTGAFDIHGSQLVYTLSSTSRQARALTIGGSPRRILEDRELTSGTAPVTGISITRDGQLVAFGQVHGSEQGIYAIPFRTGPARLLLDTPSAEDAPAWAPDGSRLAYIRRDSTVASLMVYDMTAGTSQRLGSLPVAPGNTPLLAWNRPRWSADGRKLSYVVADRHRIAVIEVPRQAEFDVPLADSIGAVYGEVVPSPDGHELMASTLHRWSDWGEIWAASVDDSVWKRVAGPFGENYPLAWGKDWLYLQNHRALSTDYGPLKVEIWRMNGLHGSPQLFVALPEGCQQADISSNGSRIVCVNLRTNSDLYVATDFDPTLQ